MPPTDVSQGDQNLVIILTNANPEDGGNGPRNPEFESDDFVEPVKVKLGQYLRRTIADSNNVYTPELGRSFQDELVLGSEDALRSFETISNSGLLPDVKIRKTTKVEAGTTSRADLYRDINADAPEALIPNSVARLQEENNRFSGNKPYINLDSTATEDNSGTKDFIPQQTFGQHTPRRWPDSDGLNNIPVTVSQLRKLGTQILLEGSGEVSLGSSTQLGDSPAARASTAIVPGIARLGGPVPYSRFSAGTIMSNVNPTFVKPKISDLENDGPEKLSYGSPYNPLVPFDSLNTSSSLVATTLLTITVYSMAMALANALKNTSEMMPGQTEGGSARQKRMGSYLSQNRTNLGTSETRTSTRPEATFFMFYKTRADYAECIKEGMKVFFDLSSKNPGFSVSTVESPGYYSVLLRSLVRDTADTFSENRIVRPLAGSRSDPTSLGRFIDNTEGLVENLRSSKVFRFMDVIAQLGDISLMLSSRPDKDSGFDSDELFVDVISDDDYTNMFGTNINQSSLIKRNRMSPGSTRANSLSMASNTVLSMYRVSDEYTRAQVDISGDSISTNMLLGDKSLYFRSTQSERLSPQDVQKFEEEMDAYYVPFYFHDLRTNEMISFHAFLETVSDGFTADYIEGEGMGRVGKTYSYKNTNRSINMSFHVVSTNSKDFDDMWLKINKLITLLYPQYTQGREITNLENGHKFIQPFSQIIGASPMIRLRVGDLIKNNFSELDLARLFGAGTKSFSISSQQQEVNAQRNADIQARIQEITTRQSQGIFEANEIFRLSSNLTYRIVPPLGDQTITQPVGRQRGRQRGRPPRPARGTTQSPPVFPNGTELKVNRVISDDGTAYVYEVSPHGRPVAGIENGANVQISIPKDSVSSVVTLLDDRIRILAQTQSQPPTLTEASSQDIQSNLREVTAFFSPEGEKGNPVVQAFQSTKGEGLAGFIKSLKFDWTGAPWETDLGSRAPKYMKIDIDFSPVHDISPGLSSDGMMIGAPYNIGNIMKAMKAKRSQASNAYINKEAAVLAYKRNNNSETDS